MGSNYKVRGKEISQVSRVMGRMGFIIDTHESLDTGSGYIATRYDAIFRNSKTNEVTSILKFEDSYEKIAEYYVMTKQVVQEYKDGTRTTTEFSYSNIKLLEPAAV
jgi:adenylate kinase